MPPRKVTYADILPASKLLAKAFETEELFGEYIHVNRAQYPDDLYLWFLWQLRTDYFRGPDNVMLLTYQADADGKEECITGFAQWIRKRAHPPKLSWYNQAMLKAVEAYNYSESLICPDRAADPTRIDVLQRADPFTKHHWTGTRAENWFLSLLGVDPAHEKKGYGREMVKWGFERAREEGLGCSVISAVGKERFYRACGYDVEVGTATDEGGDANPLKDVAGGTIHFWDNGKKPEGIKKYGET